MSYSTVTVIVTTEIVNLQVVLLSKFLKQDVIQGIPKKKIIEVFSCWSHQMACSVHLL